MKDKIIEILKSIPDTVNGFDKSTSFDSVLNEIKKDIQVISEDMPPTSISEEITISDKDGVKYKVYATFKIKDKGFYKQNQGVGSGAKGSDRQSSYHSGGVDSVRVTNLVLKKDNMPFGSQWFKSPFYLNHIGKETH